MYLNGWWTWIWRYSVNTVHTAECALFISKCVVVVTKPDIILHALNKW